MAININIIILIIWIFNGVVTIMSSLSEDNKVPLIIYILCWICLILAELIIISLKLKLN